MLKQLVSKILILILSLSTLQPVAAAEFNVNSLPQPGQILEMSGPFTPFLIKGLLVDPQNPMRLQFLVDSGEQGPSLDINNEESFKLIQYFLGGLSLPEKDLWVNLSPYEKDRVIPLELSQTVLGRDMLAQDYLLKQISASLVHPDKTLGREFWKRVFAQVSEKAGTTDVPLDTFDKVWIVPGKARIYQNSQGAYITQATLKVMLQEDYLAFDKQHKSTGQTLSSDIMRQIIIPEIEKQVNTDKNFAPLRQIYSSLILAKWYKNAIQDPWMNTDYIDQKKTGGIYADGSLKEKIYERYVQAYKKGVFNFIKEDRNIPRKYFSGGEIWKIALDVSAPLKEVVFERPLTALTVDLERIEESDKAMITNGMSMGGLPLAGLKDPKVLSVFRQIVQRRYDVSVLSEYYHLGKVPAAVTYKDPKTKKEEQISPQEYADRLVDFMVANKEEDPRNFSMRFRRAFPNMACPPELQEIFDAYMKIKTKSFDLELIKDLLPKHAIIADVGAGKFALGQEILDYADPRLVLGIDINDWRENIRKDGRLLFVQQKTGVSVPVPPNSVDVVILKWVTHHIAEEDQREFFNSIWSILKPGGRVIVVDALMSSITDELRNSFQREIANPSTWPRGSYYQANMKVSEDYMKLSKEQQKQVLSLEDYFGHNLIAGRDFMPQPFSYLGTSQIRSIMNTLGMKEMSERFRVIGSAPIERMGPPSMIMVFKKTAPFPKFILNDGGENLISLLKLNDEEREHFQRVLDTLVPREHSKSELIQADVDDIVLSATNHLDIIAEALRLLNAGIGRRIIVLENPYLMDLVDKAVSWGYKIKTPAKLINNRTDWYELKRIIRKQLAASDTLEKYLGSSVNIIQQIMTQMIKEFPQFFPALGGITDPRVINEFIVPTKSDKSGVGGSYGEMLLREGSLKTKHTAVVLSEPLFQVWVMAQMNQSFQPLIKSKKLHLMSYTVSVPPENINDNDHQVYTKQRAAESLITSTWNLLRFSRYSKLPLFEEGAEEYPPQFWVSLIYLTDLLGKSQASSLVRSFFKTSTFQRLDMTKARTNPHLMKFIDNLKSKKDQAIVAAERKTDTGGIDFNNIDTEVLSGEFSNSDTFNLDRISPITGRVYGLRPVIIQTSLVRTPQEVFPYPGGRYIN